MSASKPPLGLIRKLKLRLDSFKWVLHCLLIFLNFWKKTTGYFFFHHRRGKNNIAEFSRMPLSTNWGSMNPGFLCGRGLKWIKN